jgi:hypothetical protein
MHQRVELRGHPACTAPGVSVCGISVSANAVASAVVAASSEGFAGAAKARQAGQQARSARQAFQHLPTIQFDHPVPSSFVFLTDAVLFWQRLQKYGAEDRTLSTTIQKYAFSA